MTSTDPVVGGVLTFASLDLVFIGLLVVVCYISYKKASPCGVGAATRRRLAAPYAGPTAHPPARPPQLAPQVARARQAPASPRLGPRAAPKID